MKKLILFFAATIAITSCQTLSQSADQPKFEETHWKLIAMNKKPVNIGDNAYIEFKADSAGGKAGCNTFSADVVKVNSLLTLEKIKSTKEYCEGLMGYENQMIANLGKVKKFDIRYGLLYMYGTDELLLTFKK